jgi:poly-gamma-glutamate synthesis protein (capsule biosynthesis protein)
VGTSAVTLFLCGDVMLGRGVDQILPNAGDPSLIEPFMRDARAYVDLAEKANGPIPRPVDFRWPWGDALPFLDALAPDVRIVNLETAMTRSGEFASGKSVHYRMSPGNVDALAAGRPDVCVLANNHVLDFGRSGLVETLDVLADAGLDHAGAGRDAADAQRPVVVAVDNDPTSRVLVHSVGTASSGVPHEWRAGERDPGVAMVGLRRRDAEALGERVAAGKRHRDLAVVSIHWGSNWGYEVPPEHVKFAHQLIDVGVDVVHGHSSHHPRPIEIYRGKLILYGCGDFINDYEGIGGYEHYRDELRLLYVASVESDGGAFAGLRMIPVRARRMRLETASAEDAGWLASTLGDVSARYGVRVEITDLETSLGTVPALEAVPA